jgi:hypothetical protein
MHKRDALRLREGDRITFGRSQWTLEMDRYGGWQEGTVLFVTPRGGIRVRNDRGGEEWVAYNHVGSVMERAPRG